MREKVINGHSNIKQKCEKSAPPLTHCRIPYYLLNAITAGVGMTLVVERVGCLLLLNPPPYPPPERGQ